MANPKKKTVLNHFNEGVENTGIIEAVNTARHEPPTTIVKT
jgi:hypothetical protein